MRRAITIALSFWWAACGPESVRTPRPEAISPTQGPNDADVRVELSGANFETRVVTDFGAPSGSRADRAFRVRLVPSEDGLEAVELVDVGLGQGATLVGTVPAGAARGFYGVEVTDAFGRQGFVPELYRVVASPSRVTAFQFDGLGPQRAGIPFTVQVRAVDGLGRTVDGFIGSVALSDRTGTVSPAAIGPFALGRARAQLTIKEYLPDDVLSVVDAEGRRGDSVAFAVTPDSVVRLAFLSTPQSLPAGECSAKVLLEAQDSFGRSATAEAAIEARLLAAPPDGVTFYADADCTRSLSSATVAAGGSRMAFHFRGEVAGRFSARVVPALFPSAGQAQSVQGLAPTELGFSTPSRTVAPGACSEPVTVKAVDRFGNEGPLPESTSLSLSAAPPGVVSLHADASCASSAIFSAVIPAGASAVTFFVKGTAAGTASLAASAAPPSTLGAAQQPTTVTP